jgi:hypothetical protein
VRVRWSSDPLRLILVSRIYVQSVTVLRCRHGYHSHGGSPPETPRAENILQEWTSNQLEQTAKEKFEQTACVPKISTIAAPTRENMVKYKV